MTTKSKGRQPSREFTKVRAQAGYITVVAAAELVRKKTGRAVSVWTPYRWGRKWGSGVPAVKGKPAPAYHDGTNVWLLRAAVEEQIDKMLGRVTNGR